MPPIIVDRFDGISPRTPERFLAQTQAQTATNCANFNKTLLPQKDKEPKDYEYTLEDYFAEDYVETGQLLTLAGDTAETIYIFGEDSGDKFWFHWASDVDVVKGQIAGDTTERTFFTGDGNPKSTDLTLNTGAGPYPETSYDLGLPRPLIAPICVVTGTADTNAVPETRVYTYTWVNSWGDESAPFSDDPMPDSATVDVSLGEVVEITLPAAPAGNYDVESIRVYRSVSSGNDTSFLYVDEVSIGTFLFEDDVVPDDLGEVCPSLLWEPPPTNLEGLTGMPNGIMVGFVGRDIYFSEAYKPYAWPVTYTQTTEYPIVGLGATDTSLFVMTKGLPAIVQGSSPDLMTMVKADMHQACVSKKSIVTIGGSVFYASPDGLIRMSPAGSEIITASILDREAWQKYDPDTIHAYRQERRYVAFFDSTEYGAGGFILDLEQNIFIQHTLSADCGYYSLLSDALYLSDSNVISEWGAGDELSYTWKSKKFTFPYEVSFPRFRVDAEGSDVTIKIYRDGSLILTKAITPRVMHPMPSGRGKDWEFELTGTSEVFMVAIGTPGDLSGV